MRQLQVTVPRDTAPAVRSILDSYSHDVSSTEVELSDRDGVEFTASIDEGDIDELTEELKSVDGIRSGDLSIRVLEQASLIEKGQETQGGSSTLSQEEIYAKAQEAASFTGAQWGLVSVAAAIAAYGLVLDNVIVVIGAMMLAPVLSPLLSASLSLVVGDHSLLDTSIRNAALSFVAIPALGALAVLPFPVPDTAVLSLVVTSDVLGVVLSLLVGVAGALSFATGLRDQIAGVAVAIAIVPPLAAVGIGVATWQHGLAGQALSVAAINVLSVIIAGYLTFRSLGLSPSTYYKQQEASRMRFVVPTAFALLCVLTAPLAYSAWQGYGELGVEEVVERRARSHFGDSLISVEGGSGDVTVTVVGTHNVSRFRSGLPVEASVRVREVSSR